MGNTGYIGIRVDCRTIDRFLRHAKISCAWLTCGISKIMTSNTSSTAAVADADKAVDKDWWRGAVIYQI